LLIVFALAGDSTMTSLPRPSDAPPDEVDRLLAVAFGFAFVNLTFDVSVIHQFSRAISNRKALASSLRELPTVEISLPFFLR
jgi:hypothetical protein